MIIILLNDRSVGHPDHILVCHIIPRYLNHKKTGFVYAKTAIFLFY